MTAPLQRGWEAAELFLEIMVFTGQQNQSNIWRKDQVKGWCSKVFKFRFMALKSNFIKNISPFPCPSLWNVKDTGSHSEKTRMDM